MAGHSTPGWVARFSLLGVTVLGTMSNNVVNVPLRAIADDFDRAVSSTVLTVSAFVLVLAVAMPLAGWIGDRLGHKRTLVASLLLMLVAQLAAAVAPTLEMLIATRALQGLACSAIPPMVMSMLAGFFPERRIRMMGAWAAANGIGQAIGPPVGGLISDVAGWRAIFVVMSVAWVFLLVGIVRSVPGEAGRYAALHLPSSLSLTGGTAFLLVAATAVSQPGVPIPVPVMLAIAGVLLLIGYIGVSRGNPRAMIPPRLIVESRFLRSCCAGFAQMFVLGSMLVAVPLYFTGPLELSPSRAGLLFFVLPFAMAGAAPVVSRMADRVGPRKVLRSGLGTVIVAALATGLVSDHVGAGWLVPVFCTLMIVLGLGMAMVQTPAAAGAVRSPAGTTGAGIGLFNMVRFSGSTAGTAWVALTYPFGHMGTVFAGCAVLAALALAMSFAGEDPTEPAGVPPAVG